MAYTPREVALMEAATGAKHDLALTLGGLDDALRIGPLCQGQRPFSLWKQFLGVRVEITTVFGFDRAGNLTGCTGKRSFRGQGVTGPLSGAVHGFDVYRIRFFRQEFSTV